MQELGRAIRDAEAFMVIGNTREAMKQLVIARVIIGSVLTQFEEEGVVEANQVVRPETDTFSWAVGGLITVLAMLFFFVVGSCL